MKLELLGQVDMQNRGLLLDWVRTFLPVSYWTFTLRILTVLQPPWLSKIFFFTSIFFFFFYCILLTIAGLLFLHSAVKLPSFYRALLLTQLQIVFAPSLLDGLCASSPSDCLGFGHLVRTAPFHSCLCSFWIIYLTVLSVLSSYIYPFNRRHWHVVSMV